MAVKIDGKMARNKSWQESTLERWQERNMEINKYGKQERMMERKKAIHRMARKSYIKKEKKKGRRKRDRKK